MKHSHQPASQTVAFCAIVAVFEGFDVQSMGITIQHFAPLLHSNPHLIGLALSASILGLTLGALVGGWLADIAGRKPVLVVSMLILGAFSLLTPHVGSFGSLMTIRILAGIGLGGAFPIIIALANEVALPDARVRAISIVYAGFPIGGVLAAAIMSFASSADWRIIFDVGGFGPLVMAAVMMLALRPSPSDLAAKPGKVSSASSIRALFGLRREQTLLLWLACFFSLLAVYLLINWLPTLLGGEGISRVAGARAAVFLNVGAAAGSLVLGQMSDRRPPSIMLPVVYCGMLGSLFGLVAARGVYVYGAAFVTGFFVIGGQLILYALAPTIYPAHARATGTGAAIATGRVGSIAGPILGGAALARGLPVQSVPLVLTPGLLIAMFAAILLARKTTKGAAA